MWRQTQLSVILDQVCCCYLVRLAWVFVWYIRWLGSIIVTYYYVVKWDVDICDDLKWVEGKVNITKVV